MSNLAEYQSQMTKIYYRDEKQFYEKINKILKEASLEMPFIAKSGTPEMTTTQQCSDVYYYVKTR